jgi:hypothetical protein
VRSHEISTKSMKRFAIRKAFSGSLEIQKNSWCIKKKRNTYVDARSAYSVARLHRLMEFSNVCKRVGIVSTRSNASEKVRGMYCWPFQHAPCLTEFYQLSRVTLVDY